MLVDTSDAAEAQQKGLLSMFDDEYSPLVAFGQAAGPEALNELLDILAGQKPHIPTKEHFWGGLAREVRDHMIRGQFNGRNYAELGFMYDLDERHVRRIVHREARTYSSGTPTKRTMTVSPEHHDRLQAMADARGVTLRSVIDAVLAVALDQSDIDERVTGITGRQMTMDMAAGQ